MLRRAATASVIAACSIPGVDLGGKQCPCATGYVCDTATNTCVVGVDAAAAQGCAKDVAAKVANTCAIRTDGTLWCVGQNGSGQLGDGTTQDNLAFVQVGTPAGITAIALGAANTYALDASGAVWAWGAGMRSEMGNGIAADQPTPARIATLPKIRQIAAGESHACALDTTDALHCWGWNINGQIGSGSTIDQPTPTVVMPGVGAVVAGGRRTCAIKRLDRTVWCWGKNTEGEIGNGTTDTPITMPTQIPGFDAIELAAGGHHTCARRADNSVWCWGRNTFGQMGNGSLAQQLSPAVVPNVAGVAALDADGGRRTCAALTTGDVTCWGEAPFGMRHVSPPMMIDAPMAVPKLAGVLVFTTASDHTCAVTADHSLVCAGQNDHGQLGDGTATAHFALMPATLPCP